MSLNKTTSMFTAFLLTFLAIFSVGVPQAFAAITGTGSAQVAAVAVQQSGNRIYVSAAGAFFNPDMLSATDAASTSANNYHSPGNAHTLPVSSDGFEPALDPAFLSAWSVSAGARTLAVTSTRVTTDGYHLELTLSAKVQQSENVDVSYAYSIQDSDAADFFRLFFPGNPGVNNVVQSFVATSVVNNSTVSELDVATDAVFAAETSGLQADVTSAFTLVNALVGSAAKTALIVRLTTVQATIDAAAALAAAITAGNAALAAYTTAGGLVADTVYTDLDAALTASPQSTATIVAATTALTTATGVLTAAAAALAAATASVVAAETAVTQASVTSASALVNALTNGAAKTALLARIAVVQAAVTAAAVPPTPVNTVSSAPTGLTATAGDATATLSWSVPTSNGGASITNYVVEYSSDNGVTWTAFTSPVSTSTSITVTGLVNGRSYTFRVKAVNSVGNSVASTVSASVTPVAPVVVPVDKSTSDRTTFSNNLTTLSSKQKAGLRAYFENYSNSKNLSIQVIGYSKSTKSTKASIAAATARAKAVLAFIKTLGLDASVSYKIVSKGTKAQAVFNLKWVE